MINNLPTDNLYKFLFIGSLALILLFFYKIDSEINNLNDDTNKLNLEIAKTEHKKTFLEASGIKFDSLSNSLELSKDGSINIELVNYFADIKLIDNKKELYKEKIIKIKSRIKDFTWMIFTVSIFSIIGLILWYFRHQKYQDLLLKKQIK